VLLPQLFSGSAGITADDDLLLMLSAATDRALAQPALSCTVGAADVAATHGRGTDVTAAVEAAQLIQVRPLGLQAAAQAVTNNSEHAMCRSYLPNV